MDVQHDIEIKASPQDVWAILSDIPGYPRWNRSMQLTLDEEGRDFVTLGVAAATRAGTPHQWRLAGKLRPFREPEQVAWWLGVGGVLGLDMAIDLEPQGPNTRVRFSLRIKGLAAPFARGRLARLVADPMAGTLRDLKRAAESGKVHSRPHAPARSRINKPRRRFR
ncbi:SRPBCC family protein [Brevundimonas sp. UBA7664]|jgi:carbon monoxide dehydrogenase subunit G|uniref:SRPBCC family protein n=1 Tax=Brevundimonas sp. UBA7664 TaxID=1946141 RepID=UPI0025BBB5F3|nr:SRPBCC family protein [Brevundimonas sp. UBA7664]